MNRRNFIGKVAGLTGGAVSLPFWGSSLGIRLQQDIESYGDFSSAELARIEDYWNSVRGAYALDPNIVNLNNGGVSPQAVVVQEAVIQSYLMANKLPSYNLWRKINDKRDNVRERLAEIAGCKPGELAINRNATEGLETIIFGLTLNPGDEIVLGTYDYPAMIHAWEQRAKRDNLKLTFVEIDVPTHSDEEIVDRYLSAISENTRLVHLTHLINWTGQLIPVGKIGKLLQEKGIEVLVDGAHSFAHIDFRIDELHCDYFATSLHKWLGAPFGTGFLYVREDRIKDIYPMYAAPPNQDENILKFEHQGTRSLSIEMGIGEAIDFHEKIGLDRKQARLAYLRQYWMDALRDVEGVELRTSEKANMSAGMGLLNMPNYFPATLNNLLFNKYQFLISPVMHGNALGVRVSPNVYTRLSELDRFAEAIKDLSRK